MWPWLRSEHFKKLFELTARQKFLSKLSIISFVGHVFTLAIIVYFSFNKHERFIISSQAGNTVYVLTSLHKQIKSVGNQSFTNSKKASKVFDYETYKQLKKQQEKQELKKKIIDQSVSSKKTSKAFANSQAALKKANQSVPKKAQITVSEIKPSKKVDPLKKDSRKKTILDKKVTSPVIKEINTVKDKKRKESSAALPIHEEKIIEPSLNQNVESRVEADIKEVVTPEKPKTELLKKEESKEASFQNLDKIEQKNCLESDVDVDNVTFIGYEQLGSLAVQSKIQQVVKQNFKSPIGMKKGVSCELTVFVGDSGKSKSVTMVRSSGILVYDTSARAMLYKIEFPKEVWNKKITIMLGQ